MKKFALIIVLLIISITSFAQGISARQLKDGIVRPVESGTLADYVLTFGPEVQKSYVLPVTSDIALSLAGSGNIPFSRIYITATGDGSHTLTFPSDWKIDEAGASAFDPNVVNEIEINYRNGNFIVVKIITSQEVVIPTLTSAVMDEGTDDLTLFFSDPVAITTSGWTVTASGGAATVSAVTSGSGTTTIVFDLSRNITSGETMSISYNPASGSTTSSTGNEIALISNFFVDTGEETLPDNSITVDDSGGKDYTTISAASAAATDGQTVVIYSGTYRETVLGKTGVTYQAAPGETPIISGLNQVTDSWTSHDLTGGKSIYKAVITGGLPVDNSSGYNLTISENNTTLFNNQIFKDGAMMFEARYPNITDESDLLEFTGNMRHYSNAVGGSIASTTQVVDNSIPTTGLTGAKMVFHGWFWNHAVVVSSQPSQNTLNFSPSINNDGGLNKYRHWWYVCGKLVLLDAAKEWHYDNATNTLYLWQTGGGSPTGVEFKARNWGFDLRGVDRVTIKGITFIGCEVAHGSITTDNCVIDNVRATYTNHDVMYESLFPGYGNATETGTMLLGNDNVFKNSELRYTAGHGIWVGHNGLIQNNWYRDCGYDGSWGAPFSFTGYNVDLGTATWPNANNVRILNNTVERTGRSAVDMGPGYIKGQGASYTANLNIEVAYNDFSMWGMINVDVGAIYSWGFRNLTGTEYHHNWFHDDGILADPTGAPLHGGQYATYQDQGSGPVTQHHNVFYNNWTGLPTNAGDSYNQPSFELKNAGSTMYYNNTFASTSAPYSYKVSKDSPKDIWRNNSIAQKLNPNWGGAAPLNEQYNIYDNEITGTVTSAAGTGSLKNQDFSTNYYLGSGSGGLAYRPHASSIMRNAGTVITDITTDDDGTPDIGAYKFGDDWVPGYNAATLDDDVYIEDNNLTFTSYSVTPTVQSNSAYHGGTSSFFNTDEAYVEITISSSATGFEWYAEKFEHSGTVEVQVDGVRQDCDAGTGGTQDCDLYVNATTKNSTLIFTKTGLGTSAQKVIRLINKSVGAEGGQFVTHDAIKETN